MTRFAHLIRHGLAGAAALIATSGMAAAQTVKFVPHADLKIVDTTWTNALITSHHGNMVYDTLFAYDSKMNAKPQMVESFNKSADGLVWTFTLRKGMTFHDGSPVTAKDAVASLNRWSKRRVEGTAMMERAASLVAKDDLTFVLTLKEPFAPVLQTLSNPILATFVLREKDASGDAFQQQTFDQIIGSGPFTFVKEEWVPGAKVVYKKYAGYNSRAEPSDALTGGKVVKVDRVEWTYLPDSATAAQALIRGEVDIVEQPQADLVPMLKKDKNITVAVMDDMGWQGVARPNALHPPFNNPKARQALALLVDQTTYLTATVGEDYRKPCAAILFCGGPYETLVGAEPFRQRNVEKAKQLFAEAGYKGEPVVLMGPTDIAALNANAIITAQNLKDAGVNVDLQMMDWGTLSTRQQKKDKPGDGSPGWNMYFTSAPGTMWHTPLTNFALATPCDGKNWNGWTCDEEMERIRLSFLTAATPEAQKQVAERLQARFYEVMPFVSLGQYVTPKAWRNNISGVVNSREIVMWGLEKK